MIVAVQEVMVMSQTPDLERDPICGFCMVGRGLKPRLRRQRDGSWRCPVCRAVTVHPTDPDATARDLEIMFVEGAESTRRRQEEAENEWYAKPRVFQRGPIILKGGSKGGRKRKKSMKFEPPPRYTLA